MAKTKAELMAEKMKNERVAKAAFEAGKKPSVKVANESEPSSEMENQLDFDPFHRPCGTQGKKGEKTRRMNLAIQNDVYEFIRKESRKAGMTYSEYICAMTRHYKNFYTNN